MLCSFCCFLGSMQSPSHPSIFPVALPFGPRCRSVFHGVPICLSRSGRTINCVSLLTLKEKPSQFLYGRFLKTEGGFELSLGTFCAWKGNWRKRLGLPGLSARGGAISKATSDKTPSFVGLNGLFYEKSALLWQKGRIRHLVCFLLLAYWPVEGG